MIDLFSELKRRNVIRVGIAYAIVAWLVLQVADLVLENIDAPAWVMQVFMLAVAAGLPLVLVFAWAFELTPEGIKREKDVDRDASITPRTGQRLNRSIVVLLVLALGYVGYDLGRDILTDEGGDAQPGLASPVRQQAEGISAEAQLKPTAASDPVAAFAPANSIAVLPFANRSKLDDDLFFTDGIHDDLLTQLTKIQGLKVISRTSVMEYRDTTKKIPEIAEELGVATILEGGVQRAGKRIRINAQLINVATDEHLWAETFDREMTVDNIFDIQTEITRQIVTAVRGELSEEEANSLGRSPTDNLDAYEAYLHALSFGTSSDELETLQAVREWTLRATELDPNFAEAWALLVKNQALMAWFGYTSENQASVARAALDRAMQLAPESPATLAAQGEYLYRINTDYVAARNAFSAASAALPNDADLLHRLATIERRNGEYEQSILTYQRAIELAPNNYEYRKDLLQTMIFVRRWPDVEALCQEYLRQFPQADIFYATLAWVEMNWHGDLDQAEEWLSRTTPSDSYHYYNVRIELSFLRRDYAGILAFLSSPLMQSKSDNAFLGPQMLFLRAKAHYHLGQPEQVLPYVEELERRVGVQISYRNDAYFGWELWPVALANAYAGRTERALELMQHVLDLLVRQKMDSFEGPALQASQAWMLGMAGQRDEMLAQLERLLRQPGYISRRTLAMDPDWDFFRDDERFNALIAPEGAP